MSLSTGERIRQARLASGYDTPDAVEIATNKRITKSYVYQIEKIGNRPDAANPTLDVLTFLADLYGVGVGEFFEPVGVVTSELLGLGKAVAALNENTRRRVLHHLAEVTRELIVVFSNAQRLTHSTSAPSDGGEDVAGIPGDILANHETTAAETRRNLNRRTPSITASGKRPVPKLPTKK